MLSEGVAQPLGGRDAVAEAEGEIAYCGLAEQGRLFLLGQHVGDLSPLASVLFAHRASITVRLFYLLRTVSQSQ